MGLPFAGEFEIVGCHGYNSGEFEGRVFYGYLTGGAEVEHEAELNEYAHVEGAYRLEGTYDCPVQNPEA